MARSVGQEEGEPLLWRPAAVLAVPACLQALGRVDSGSLALLQAAKPPKDETEEQRVLRLEMEALAAEQKAQMQAVSGEQPLCHTKAALAAAGRCHHSRLQPICQPHATHQTHMCQCSCADADPGGWHLLLLASPPAQELSRVALRQKQAREQECARINSMKIHNQWRKIMRVAKVEELRGEVEILSQNHEREVDRKDALVQVRLGGRDKGGCHVLQRSSRALVAPSLLHQGSSRGVQPVAVRGQCSVLGGSSQHKQNGSCARDSSCSWRAC